MFDYFKLALTRYSDFNGRSRRKEYWIFVLFNLLFASIAAFIDNAAGLTYLPSAGLGPIETVYVIIMFVPSVAVAVRRLHDTGKTGWLLFLAIIPIIGTIILIVFFVQKGDEGSNQYGVDPKTNDPLSQSNVL
ncbi:MAG: DUF805 domain-containing protein [Cyclobacteriaceae bacterium]|nr:DUF805 domain-containing protein [Cyclobacteriaceae bacterium]MCH8517260.1 DUF805 domain-containing protein [Cyclobacteriaceae bacterium]